MNLHPSYQIFILTIYFLDYFLCFTTLLTTVALIKSDQQSILLILLIGQFMELSCSSILARFPIGFKFTSLNVVSPLIFLTFITGNLICFFTTIYSIIENTNGKEISLLMIIILVRISISFFGWISSLVLIKFKHNVLEQLQGEGRRLSQYLHGIYQPDLTQQLSII